MGEPVSEISSSVSVESQPVLEIDTLVEEVLTEWKIPGLALAIIHKGEEIKVAGYGVKKRGQPDRVDEQTMFQICSLTKAVTATTIGMLVDEGKLEWDRPIKEYLPSFQLKDSLATDKMTLRDLLCQRTGLPGISNDSSVLWYHTDRSPDELLSRLKDVEPLHPFRTRFTYNDMSYVVAAMVAEKVTKKPLSQLFQEKIFSPFGMQRTHTSYDALTQEGNVASPHNIPFYRAEPLQWENWECLIAAAGINSCARDMARWLLGYMNTKNASQREIQKSQTLINVQGFLKSYEEPAWQIFSRGLEVVHYGLGWMMYTLNNKKILMHPGMGGGMQSIMAVVPEKELGIVILTNEAPQLGAACLLNQLLDLFLDRPREPWLLKAQKASLEIQSRIISEKMRLESSKGKQKPTLPVSEYVGTYEHPAYGSIKIILDGEKIIFEFFTQEKGILKMWDGDKFEIVGIPTMFPWIVEFDISKGRVSGLNMPNMGFFSRVKEET